MSMTAKERAEAIWLEWPTENDRTHATFIRLVSAALRAHANAALEAAAKVAENLCTEEDFHGHSRVCPICEDIAAAIRALCEE